MTIEEVEQWAKQNKFTIVADEWWDAAQDIISKYRKVQELVKFGNANELGFEYIGEKITEVIENDKTTVEVYTGESEIVITAKAFDELPADIKAGMITQVKSAIAITGFSKDPVNKRDLKLGTK